MCMLRILQHRILCVGLWNLVVFYKKKERPIACVLAIHLVILENCWLELYKIYPSILATEDG